MIWDLIWSAIMPCFIFFITAMAGLAFFVRYEEDRQRKLKLEAGKKK